MSPQDVIKERLLSSAKANGITLAINEKENRHSDFHVSLGVSSNNNILIIRNPTKLEGGKRDYYHIDINRVEFYIDAFSSVDAMINNMAYIKNFYQQIQDDYNDISQYIVNNGRVNELAHAIMKKYKKDLRTLILDCRWTKSAQGFSSGEGHSQEILFNNSLNFCLDRLTLRNLRIPGNYIIVIDDNNINELSCDVYFRKSIPETLIHNLVGRKVSDLLNVSNCDNTIITTIEQDEFNVIKIKAKTEYIKI